MHLVDFGYPTAILAPALLVACASQGNSNPGGGPRTGPPAIASNPDVEITDPASTGGASADLSEVPPEDAWGPQPTRLHFVRESTPGSGTFVVVDECGLPIYVPDPSKTKTLDITGEGIFYLEMRTEEDGDPLDITLSTKVEKKVIPAYRIRGHLFRTGKLLLIPQGETVAYPGVITIHEKYP